MRSLLVYGYAHGRVYGLNFFGGSRIYPPIYTREESAVYITSWSESSFLGVGCGAG